MCDVCVCLYIYIYIHIDSYVYTHSPIIICRACESRPHASEAPEVGRFL